LFLNYILFYIYFN